MKLIFLIPLLLAGCVSQPDSQPQVAGTASIMPPALHPMALAGLADSQTELGKKTISTYG